MVNIQDSAQNGSDTKVALWIKITTSKFCSTIKSKSRNSMCAKTSGSTSNKSTSSENKTLTDIICAKESSEHQTDPNIVDTMEETVNRKNEQESARANDNPYSELPSTASNAHPVEGHMNALHAASKHQELKEGAAQKDLIEEFISSIDKSQGISSKQLKQMADVSKGDTFFAYLRLYYHMIFFMVSRNHQRLMKAKGITYPEASSKSLVGLLVGSDDSNKMVTLYIFLAAGKGNNVFEIDTPHQIENNSSARTFIYAIHDKTSNETLKMSLSTFKVNCYCAVVIYDEKCTVDLKEEIYHAIMTSRSGQDIETLLGFDTLPVSSGIQEDPEHLTELQKLFGEYSSKSPDTDVRIVMAEEYGEWAYHRAKEVIMTLLGGLDDARATAVTYLVRFKCLRNSMEDFGHVPKLIFECLMVEAGIMRASLFMLLKENSAIKDIRNILGNLFH